MSRRTANLQRIPWIGGVNSATDSGIIPDTDLTIADNVVFSSTGARVKRQGHSYYDSLSELPAVTHRASSGTTRTLTFASKVSEALIDRIVAGELLNISGASGVETTSYAAIGIEVDTAVLDSFTITYTGVGSLTEGTTATSTMSVQRAAPVIRLKDYWRFTGSAQAQLLMAVTSEPKVWKYDSAGRRKEIPLDSGATARIAPTQYADMLVFNERLIVAQGGLGNTPLKYRPEDDGGELTDLGGNAPDFSVMASHLNRIWTNDKANRDRLHYSASGNHEAWQGLEDSGALDIRPGDGDPVGIIGVKVFKGRVFVFKKNKMYQIVGDSPENFQVLDVSEGLGGEAHMAWAAIDQDDALYLSSKGAHSIATTDKYGDFESAYLSAKIQPTYNDFERSQLPYAQAAYIPTINSVAFAVSESDTNILDTIWLYNVQVKEWYRWPLMDAQALETVLFSSIPTLFYGTSDGRIVRTQNGTYTDFDAAGIKYRIKSGTIYPDGSPHTVKGFKRITLFFRPVGSYSFVCRVKIDNYSEQVLVFSQQDTSSDLLDINFILGSSLLGASSQFAPNTLPIDGYGRGMTLEIEQTGNGEQIAIYGFDIEFEGADISQEVVTDED